MRSATTESGGGLSAAADPEGGRGWSGGGPGGGGGGPTVHGTGRAPAGGEDRSRPAAAPELPELCFGGKLRSATGSIDGGREISDGGGCAVGDGLDPGGPGEGSSLPPTPGGGGRLGAALAAAAAAATAAAAAAAEEEAESLAMAAADARMTAAAEGPRGAAKLVRGTRNMAASEREREKKGMS